MHTNAVVAASIIDAAEIPETALSVHMANPDASRELLVMMTMSAIPALAPIVRGASYCTQLSSGGTINPLIAKPTRLTSNTAFRTDPVTFAPYRQPLATQVSVSGKATHNRVCIMRTKTPKKRTNIVRKNTNVQIAGSCWSISAPNSTSLGGFDISTARIMALEYGCLLCQTLSGAPPMTTNAQAVPPGTGGSGGSDADESGGDNSDCPDIESIADSDGDAVINATCCSNEQYKKCEVRAQSIVELVFLVALLLWFLVPIVSKYRDAIQGWFSVHG